MITEVLTSLFDAVCVVDISGVNLRWQSDQNAPPAPPSANLPSSASIGSRARESLPRRRRATRACMRLYGRTWSSAGRADWSLLEKAGLHEMAMSLLTVAAGDLVQAALAPTIRCCRALRHHPRMPVSPWEAPENRAMADSRSQHIRGIIRRRVAESQVRDGVPHAMGPYDNAHAAKIGGAGTRARRRHWSLIRKAWLWSQLGPQLGHRSRPQAGPGSNTGNAGMGGGTAQRLRRPNVPEPSTQCQGQVAASKAGRAGALALPKLSVASLNANLACPPYRRKQPP